MESTSPSIRPNVEIRKISVYSEPPDAIKDDPAISTIEALKKQSVVYLNSSVQIFRTGSAAPLSLLPNNKDNTDAAKPRVERKPSPAEVFINRRQLDVVEDDRPNWSESDSEDEDDSYSNGWDDFGSEENSCDRTIDYICRRCGTTFQSSSAGEYYYCNDCKPIADNAPQLQVAQVQPMQQLHYAKYTCKNCGVEFYSKVGNYNLCEVCSGLHKTAGPKKSHEHFLQAAIQRAQQSSASHKHFINLSSIMPLTRNIPGQPTQATGHSPFTWGYTRKECKVCGQDFYNRIENWFYCPKCVANSSSLKSKKKKPIKNKLDVVDIKKEILNESENNENDKNKEININVSGEPKQSETDNGISIKREVQQICQDQEKQQNAVEPQDNAAVPNGEIKENKINKDEKTSTAQTITFKFILYSCKLCRKTFYSNLVDCFYCQLCCNANSITRRSNKGADSESEEERRIERLRGQEIAKAEKYDKYLCKVCSKEFYSAVGEWDFCNNCNSDPNHPNRNRNRVVSSFTRKNVTFHRYSCNICKNSFFSSREDQDCCKKCTRIMHAMKTQTPSDEDENCPSKWENVVYAKYICKICEKPFYSKVGEYYYCSECNPETKFMIKNKKMFACAHCDYETHLKKELRKHLLSIPREMKRKCACCQCYKTAVPLADGEEQEAVVFQCRKCDYTTKYKKRYKMHKQLVHKAKVQLYSCKHCKFQSCHKGRLKCHIMTKHEGLKVYQCEQCDYATRQSGRLTMHVAVVHYGETPYPCAACDAKFGTKALLKAHITAEHEPKVIQCQKCEFTTTKKDQFKSHMINHRDNDVLVCSECDFSTADARNLLKHLVSTHGEKSAQKCTMCDFKSSQKRRLEVHIIGKHLNNSYKCSKCNFSSADLMRLKKHSTFSHHRPKKYRKNPIIQHCPYCDYKVKQVKRFTDHLATLHPNEPPIEPVVVKKKRWRNRKSKNNLTYIGEPMVTEESPHDSQDEQINDSGEESGNSSDDNSDENNVCNDDTESYHDLSQVPPDPSNIANKSPTSGDNSEDVAIKSEEVSIKSEPNDNCTTDPSNIAEQSLAAGTRGNNETIKSAETSIKSEPNVNCGSDTSNIVQQSVITDSHSDNVTIKAEEAKAEPNANFTPDACMNRQKETDKSLQKLNKKGAKSSAPIVDSIKSTSEPDNSSICDKDKTVDNGIMESVTDKAGSSKRSANASDSVPESSPSPKKFRYECPHCTYKGPGRKELRNHVCS